MSERSGARRALDAIAHIGAAATIGLVLITVAQPIWTDDAWWHLALGAAYAESGPWLSSDPLAFTTPGPPPPTSWLADWSLHQIHRVFGFAGLRIFHLLGVIASLALTWSILRRASRNPAAASVGTALFAGLSTYRLVQLRPHLFSIFAVLLLFRLLLESRRAPSWTAIGSSVVLLCLWANVHPVYPLGPVLIGASIVGLGAASALGYGARKEAIGDGANLRLRRLAIAFGMGGMATVANPMGASGYLKAFAVGSGTESLAIVVDEWHRFEPFRPPPRGTTESVLLWLVTWLAIVIVFAAIASAVRRWRVRKLDARTEGREWLDPVLIVVSLIGLVAMLSASRFAWLSVFPIALALSNWRSSLERTGPSLTIALLSIAFVPGFLLLGDWAPTTRGLPPSVSGFKVPYAAGKYHAPAVWFLRDAQLEGNLFGRYSEGGFQSFWLGPNIRTAMNGALNMPEGSLASSLSLRERLGTAEAPRFEDALDALGVDLFVGSGLPMEGRPGRPPSYSTNYLERSTEWVLVFRNLDSAVYLRRNGRNRANLERVRGYYAEKGLRFDSDLGFRPLDALRDVPAWARAQGIGTAWLEGAYAPKIGTRRVSQLVCAWIALGAYERAAAANDKLLDVEPTNRAALERRLWLLLRPGRSIDVAAVDRAIARLTASSSTSAIGRELLSVAKAVLADSSGAERSRYRAPIFARGVGRALLASIHAVEIR